MTLRHSIILVAVLLMAVPSLAQQPVITSFSPTSGPVGATVTITGTGFNANPVFNAVFFGTVRASISGASATSLTVTVPAGATFEPISVLKGGQLAYSSIPFLPTFTGGDGIVAGTFATKADFAVGSIANSIAVGDLDGDGKLDVAVANSGAHNFSVFHNTSSGTGNISFATRQDVSTGASSNPTCVAVKDLDGDGLPEIVITRGAPSISDVLIFLNTSTLGNIAFAAGVNFATGNNPYWVAINDMDGDGKPDLAVANAGTGINSVSILRSTSSGAGNINFAAKADFATGAGPRHVAIGDLDGDGKPDLAVAATGGNVVSVLRNASSGSGNINFDSKLDFTMNQAYSVAIGDLNGNGTADLAAVSYSPNTLSVFRYNGTGPGNISYAAKVDFTPGNNPTSVSMGDLDGDGKIDMVTANQSLLSVSVFRNTHTSTAISFAGGLNFTTEQNPSVPAIGDLDGDGKGDLVVSTQLGFMSVLRNLGDVTAPLATAKSPLDDATNVSASSNLVLTLNENIVKGTGNILVREFGDITQTIPVGSASVVVSGNTVTIDPADFTPGAAVNIEIPSTAFKDAANNNYSGIADATAWNFSVLPPPPTISSFNPTSAQTGVIVTIMGTNFLGATAVSFGGTPASSFTVNSAIEIKATVANGASGNVSVTTAGGSASLAGFGFVLPLSITSFTPPTGTIGTWVTITGVSFSTTAANNTVKFGGTTAVVVGTPTSTSIVAIVPAGTTTGNITVQVGSETANSSTPFTVTSPPAITSFSPESAPVGASVTITGTGFSPTPASNIVFFGAVKASVSAATATGLTVTVPAGATFDPITVLTSGLVAATAKPFLPTFPNGQSIVAGTFAPKADFATGQLSQSAAIADLDGDGKSDVVVSNQADHSIGVLRNTSTGTGNISFATRVDLSTDASTSPNSVAIRDLDGDGKPDVVVARQASSSVSVFRNLSTSGTISFAPKIDITTGANPFWVVIEDMDRDGRADLVVANAGGNSVSILRSLSSGPGNITFATKIDIVTGTEPRHVAAGDLDGDGKPDLAVACTDGNVVSVLRNTSGGAGLISFAAKLDFIMTQAYSVAIGDLNGNGTADLAAVSYGTNTLSVFRYNGIGAGNISYAAKVDFTTGNNPTSVTMGDIDGDGKVDLVTANQSLLSVSILRNTNTGTGAISFSAAVNFATEQNPSVAAIGDLDGDGKSDLAVSTQFNFLSVLLNKGDVIAPQVTALTPADNALAVSTTSNLVLTFNETVSKGTGNIIIREGGNVAQTIAVTSALVTVAGTTVTIDPPNFTEGAAVNIEIPATALVDASGNSYGGIADASAWNFTVVPGTPTITSFNPTSSVAGGTVTITGTALQGATAVSFGGTDATSFNVVSATSITAVVGTGASGSVSVTTPGGTASLSGFTFSNPVTVSGFNPTTGPAGTSVTISGTNFSTTAANNIVKFNGTTAVITGTPTATSIVTSVPVGATTGKITVEVAGITATSAADFTISTGTAAPTVSGFNPTSGTVGTSVTISGTNFSTTPANNIVKFNGITAAITGTPTATSIVTTVPVGATTGKITVEVAGTTATSVADFTVTTATATTPTVSSFNPTSGTVGTSVTISGTNFSTTAANNIVKFNGTTATITGTPTATSIVTLVPTGATTGKITVEVAGITATSATDFAVTSSVLVQITNSTLPTSFTRGGTLTASITVNDATKVSSVALVTRGISEASSATKSTSVTAAGNKYEKVIAAADLVDPIGLYYYFEVTDLDLGKITSETKSAHPTIPATSTEQVPTGLSFGSQVSNYQIIAFPFVFSNNAATSVLTALGTYDKTKWRLFDYANADNREYPAFNTIDPGKGYWLIVKNTATINPGAATSVPAAINTPFSIPIVAGWNLIGNPYNFRVSWADVVAANADIAGLDTKVKVFTGGTLADATVLEKFRGAFVFSNSAGSLKFPVTRNSTLGRTHETAPGKFALDQPYWEVPLKLSDGELTNELGGIGMHPDATLLGKDAFDAVTVPLPEGLSLFELTTQHPEVRTTFSKEVVPTAGNFKWSFEVKGTNGSRQVAMTWDNSYFGQNDKELILFEPSSMQVVDMRSADRMNLPTQARELTVLFGSREFIENELDEYLPFLGTPYPIPSRAEVTIPFRVSKNTGGTDLKIRIYDSKGMLVETPVDRYVAPGNYEVKCLAEAGPGLYIVRMETAGKPNQFGKIIIQ